MIIYIWGQKEMKRKTRLSAMIALLMVISTFTVVMPSVVASEAGLCVEKEIWDGNKWVNDINAIVGDVVEFKITITYYNESNNCVSNIVVTDTLPMGLKYKETVCPEEEPVVKVSGNTLVWDFGKTQLCHGNSITIKYTAKVIEGNYGENVNVVNVTAKELCGPHDLSGDDTAIVVIDPSLTVEKTVWNPDQEQWVEHLDSVIKAKDVRFQIEITYYGPGYITCMEVEDYFDKHFSSCDCLEYLGNEEFFYPNEELFGDPEITVGINNKSVTYLWGFDVLFNLADGEGITIQFDADVIDYCYCDKEYDTTTNNVDVYGWNCAGCEPLYGYDYATVSCRPHDPIFEKTVKYEKFWVEETTAHIGDLVTFKLELTYYGSYNLTDIIITDHLPKNILQYANEATLVVYRYSGTAAGVIPYEPFDGDTSENGTVVTFTIPTTLSDNEGLKITFDAKVIGLTGDCEYCGTNIAEFVAVESETQYLYSGSDEAIVITFDKVPIDLCLGIKRLNLGKINVYIANNGADDLPNVAWTLTVTGGLLKRINIYNEGSVDIPSGTVVSLSTPARSVVRKFGRVQVLLTAEVEGEIFEKTMNGFTFGRIILIRPLIRR